MQRLQLTCPCTHCILWLLLLAPIVLAQSPTVTTDPVTRYFHITYPIPADAPDTVNVLCSVAPRGLGRVDASACHAAGVGDGAGHGAE